jgi:hypothetical protein
MGDARRMTSKIESNKIGEHVCYVCGYEFGFVNLSFEDELKIHRETCKDDF